MTTTMHANYTLTIDGCANEIERDARARGEKPSREDLYGQAHILLSQRMAMVKERVIATMRASGKLPGMRHMSTTKPAPAPATALHPEASAMVATMLSNLLKEVMQSCQLDAAAATAAVKLAVNALSVPTMTAADDESDDDDGGTAMTAAPTTRAAKDLPRFVPAGMTALDAAQRAANGMLPMRTSTPDTGARARELQAGGMSWEAAVAQQYDEEVQAAAARPSTRIRTRREINQAKAGAK
jgi:hypothetical protein